MSIILVRLHDFLVWRAIHQHITNDMDWYQVGIQISGLMQLLMPILDLMYDRSI